MQSRILLLGAAMVLAVAATPGDASGQVRTIEDDDWCERQRWSNDDGERYCEVREMTISADRSVIEVNGRTNGGIKVAGWDKNEILLRAKVQAHADSEREAREMVGEVEISTGSTIQAKGPGGGGGHRDEWWSVSYELFVPNESKLDLETLNGGITITDVEGDISFKAINGGIVLDGLSGDIRGRTTNGGLNITLTGKRWQGAGLDARTTNGGVRMYIPEDYSAMLESGTVNGSFRIDFPITIQGRLDSRRITARLGDGGTAIRASTTNGGVTIKHKG